MKCILSTERRISNDMLALCYAMLNHRKRASQFRCNVYTILCVTGKLCEKQEHGFIPSHRQQRCALFSHTNKVKYVWDERKCSERRTKGDIASALCFSFECLSPNMSFCWVQTHAPAHYLLYMLLIPSIDKLFIVLLNRSFPLHIFGYFNRQPHDLYMQ